MQKEKNNNNKKNSPRSISSIPAFDERPGVKVSVNIPCKTCCILVTVFIVLFAPGAATDLPFAFSLALISQAPCEAPDEGTQRSSDVTAQSLQPGTCPSRLSPSQSLESAWHGEARAHTSLQVFAGKKIIHFTSM